MLLLCSEPVSSDLSRPRLNVDPTVRARVCAWVTEVLELPEDGFVRVTQVQCRDPGCAPLETAIVFDRNGRVCVEMIYKATADISREDILALRGGMAS